MALTIEVYQSNTITHDEFMTILDDLHSDIKMATFAQVDLQDFFDTSLLTIRTIMTPLNSITSSFRNI